MSRGVRREWWYVLALCIFILLLVIVFREEVGLSPDYSDDSRSGKYLDEAVLEEMGFFISEDDRGDEFVRNLEKLFEARSGP
jgi:hypothetical protein